MGDDTNKKLNKKNRGAEMTFKTIFIQTSDDPNEPLLAYRVGLMGCIKITEIKHEPTVEGIDCYGYIVSFENGDTIEVKNTLMAEG